jgi:hypothetical protein
VSTCEHEWEDVIGDWCRRCGTLQHRRLVMPAPRAAEAGEVCILHGYAQPCSICSSNAIAPGGQNAALRYDKATRSIPDRRSQKERRRIPPAPAEVAEGED